MIHPYESEPFQTRAGGSPDPATHPLAPMAWKTEKMDPFGHPIPSRSSPRGRVSRRKAKKVVRKVPHKTFGTPYFPHRAHQLSSTRF